MKKMFLLLSVLVLSAMASVAGERVVVYVSFHEREALALFEGCEAKTGLKFDYVRGPTGELFARALAEKDNPKVDIMLGGSIENHEALKAVDMLVKYDSPEAAAIPEYYKDKDQTWSGFYIGPVSIAVNKERWESEFKGKAEIPKTFEDLLNPVFKGEIVMPDPSRSGTGYNMLAGIVQSMGEEKAMDFLKKFKPQVAQFPSSGFKPAQMVGQGEYLISLNFIHDQLLINSQGMPLYMNVPPGASWEIGAVSIVKNGPNTEGAKKFVDFVLSKQGGDIHSGITMRLSTRSDVDIPPGATAIDKLDINTKFDFEKAAADKKRLVAAWNEM